MRIAWLRVVVKGHDEGEEAEAATGIDWHCVYESIDLIVVARAPTYMNPNWAQPSPAQQQLFVE